MRMNYRTYPTDYVQELNQKRGVKGRKKSRAFMEYWNDMEFGDHHSEPFYAKSWEVSKSTAHEWIKEFMYEIELFLSHWDIKNKQHYNYAKNQAEKQPRETRGSKAQNLGVSEDSAEKQPREEFNNISTTTAQANTDVAFMRFFSECKLIGRKYVGKKDEVYKSYMNIKEIIDINLILEAYKKYVSEDNNKTVGVVKFIEELYYIPYLPKRVKVKSKDGREFIGEYKQEDQVLELDSGKKVSFTNSMYIEKLFTKQMEFVK